MDIVSKHTASFISKSRSVQNRYSLLVTATCPNENFCFNLNFLPSFYHSCEVIRHTVIGPKCITYLQACLVNCSSMYYVILQTAIYEYK